MGRIQISMDYYPEGDMLSITFGTLGRKGHGYELSEHIYICVDLSTHEPLGLAILSYSKLVGLGEVTLSLWDELTPEEQEMIRAILLKEPVNRFIQLKEDLTMFTPVSTFPDIPLQEIVAA